MTDLQPSHSDPFGSAAHRDPFAQSGSAGSSDPYAQLGLEPGASMRDIEAAYWRFAARLKGQAAMKPYTDAYQALVDRSAPRRADALPAPDAPLPDSPANPILPDSPANPILPDSPPKPVAGSKFNWPPIS